MTVHSDPNPYEAILHMLRPKSARPIMTNLERAAQFSPFAALSGYDDAVKETARLTEEQEALGDWTAKMLNEKLLLLTERERLKPPLTVTYFQPDEKKTGGKYVTVQGTLKKMKTYERELLLADGTVIPLDAILDMESDIFSELDE